MAALACNLDADILAAALPLLEAERVEAIEWSFDTLFWAGQVPAWFESLLEAYGSQQRMLGHGVYFSLLLGRWTSEQQWLGQLRQLAARFSFAHITEHFGFLWVRIFTTARHCPSRTWRPRCAWGTTAWAASPRPAATQ